jgi:DNA-directed RNA polymerase subunit RPC12/RpoP
MNIKIVCARCGERMIVRAYTPERNEYNDFTLRFEIDCPICSMEMDALRYAERMRPEAKVG